MASTYSSNLGLELQATGENSATWGTKTNTNLELLEDAISDVGAITHDDTANYTLSDNNGSVDQSRSMVLEVSGTLTAARNLVVPTNDKLYVVKNGTTGGYAITVKTSAGTGISIANGRKELVYCDGTNVESAIDKLDGITATVTELNLLDGVTSTTAELNILDGVTSTAAELNILDGVTSTAAELNTLDGITATVTELNLLDGVTSTTAELNILDGVTSTAAELNILDGVTSTAAELNILDGVTSTAAELNTLDGITATVTELNYTDGVTSAIQTQIDAKQATIANDGLSGDKIDGGTISNFTSTGIDDNATSTAITIDASEKVGINDSTPNAPLSVQSDSGVNTVRLLGRIGANNEQTLKFMGSDDTTTLAQIYVDSNNYTTFGTSTALPLILKTNSQERMRINSSGKVGIGTSSPTAKLDVRREDASGLVAEFHNNAGYGVDIGTSTAEAYISSGYIQDLLIKTDSGSGQTERLRITSSGNVGIGTTAPGGRLDISYGGYQEATGGALKIGADIGDLTTRTNATNKFGIISVPHYTNAEQGIYLMSAYSQAAATDIYIGGGDSNWNAATDIKFYTAANNTTVSGTQRMIIDSSGNLGIGTSSPSAKAHIRTASSGSSVAAAGDELFVEGSGDAGITVGAGNTSKASLLFADDGDNAAGRIRYDHSDNSMQFGTNGQAERLRIQANGGISFNGDTAAANALDDYEEGTWTPVIGGVSGGSATYTTQTGRYTKVGRLVTAHWAITVNTWTHNAGNAYVSMPFSSDNSGYSGSIGLNSTSKTDINHSRFYTAGAAAYLYDRTGGTTSGSVTFAGKTISGTIIYYV